MPIPVRKIISGGQTGADRGGLLAARELELETGGVAPHGWLTENGPQEELLRSFSLAECEEEGYPARTRLNVAIADGRFSSDVTTAVEASSLTNSPCK